MAVAEVGVALLILVVFSSFGLKVLRWTKLANGPNLASFLFGWAVGLGTVGVLTLLLGLAGLLYPLVAWIVVAVMLAVSHREAWGLIRGFITFARRLRARELWSVLLGVAVVGSVLMSLVAALSPPVFYDSLVAHLAHPNWSVINHAIEFRPYNVYTNYPLNIEMVYTFAGLLLRGDQLAKLVNLMLGIAAGLTVFSVGSRFFSRRTASIGAATFYLIPSISILSGLATHDLGLLLFEITAVYSFFLWLTGKGRGWMLLSGVLCGFAMGTKYTGLYFFVTCLLVMVVRLSFDRRGFRRLFSDAAVYGIVALLISSPWFVKNGFFTGNPFYPVLTNLFGTSEFQKVGFGLTSGKAALDVVRFLRLPWDMTFMSTRFGSASQIGPLFLLSAILIPFVRRVNRELRYMLVFSLVLFVFWAVTIINTRYYLPGLAILSLWIGYCCDRLLAKRRVAWLVWIVLGAGLLYNVIHAANLNTYLFDPGAVVFGRQTKREYLAERIEHYPVIMYANENLSSDSKILFIGEARTYYTRINYEANSAYDKTLIVEMIKRSETLDDLMSILGRDGFTHVIYNGREAYRLNEEFDYFDWESAEEKELFDFFTSTRLETVYKHGESYLLRILY